MPVLMRGALVEYKSEFIGRPPNIVVFQFNPEQLARTITIPARDDQTVSGTQHREWTATSGLPIESFTVTAHFSAADDLGRGGAVSAIARLGTPSRLAGAAGSAAIPRLFGVGPQLAALEKMVYPQPALGGAAAAIDAVASQLPGATQRAATRPVPRRLVPNILFVWGARILPVAVTSLTITENKFDFLLNPVQAEVAIGLEVATEPPDDDALAKGALAYTNRLKDRQAALNLANLVKDQEATLTNVAELARDVVPF